MILGDFNRGKSTILNVLLGKELLPMGVTPTTSIPTHILYGTQEAVKIYKKDGSCETMKIQDYHDKYTLNFNYVKNFIKNIAKTVDNWLNTLDKAEIFIPIELLSRGVKFIDTAGLNSSDAEDKKTLSYIPSCDAVLFVLSGREQLTSREQYYINSHVKDKVGSVFFLINHSDNVSVSDRKEIYEAFVNRFTECLALEREIVEAMWGQTIFDV
jgi:predicted GTPase